jgi:thymidylate synthase
MERYWPKYAGNPFYYPGNSESQDATVIQGIRYEYGDLRDVVELLANDPYTRQAYLPVWFPEDTGGGSKRAPCTIGYHFMMREDKLDINYHIRSCDFIRHFRDDIYLTVRLQLWVLEQCRKLNPQWDDVTLGRFDMQIGSLHVFRNDYLMMGK